MVWWLFSGGGVGRAETTDRKKGKGSKAMSTTGSKEYGGEEAGAGADEENVDFTTPKAVRGSTTKEGHALKFTDAITSFKKRRLGKGAFRDWVPLDESAPQEERLGTFSSCSPTCE